MGGSGRENWAEVKPEALVDLEREIEVRVDVVIIVIIIQKF